METAESEGPAAPFELLAELLTLADYLDIQSLLFLTAARIAWHSQGVPLAALPQKLTGAAASASPTAAEAATPILGSANAASFTHSTIPPVVPPPALNSLTTATSVSSAND